MTACLPLTAYSSLLHPTPFADPIWRRVARWLVFSAVYLLFAVVVVILFSLAIDEDDSANGVSSGGAATLLIIVSGCILAALLALCIRLRPRPLSDPVNAPPGVFVLHAWGAPRALTLPITLISYIAAIAVIFGGMRWGAERSAGIWIWLTWVVAVILILTVGVVVMLACDRVVLALRRRLQRLYPSRALLVAGPAGLAAATWGPLAWAAVRDVRLQWFTAGKNRILMLAVDTVAPPAPDDPRARWSHRYLHGDAFIVDLRRAVLDEHEALAAIRARRPGS